jgi:CHAT domain-containing protein/Tfp pilus assembly protein PilF
MLQLVFVVRKVFLNMPTTSNLSKTLRRTLIHVSHQSLIWSIALPPLCGIVSIALFSESVIAIPSNTRLQIAQQPVSTEPTATRALEEGIRLYEQGDKASLQQAIVKFKEGLKLFQQVGDRGGEATTLSNIANVYSELGEQQQALTYYNQALPLLRAVGDRRGEAGTLTSIGLVYWALGEHQQALTYHNQALPLNRAVGDRGEEAATLTGIGLVYLALGDNQQALTYYNQALPLNRAVGDRGREANTLTNIGLVYSNLGEQQQALTYYNQALPLLRAVGDRRGEAGTLSNIGNVYWALGEHQQALTYHNQALPLLRAVGDRRGEAITLTGIGLVYSALGEHQQALTYYNQALPLNRAVGDRSVEANTLTNIGLVYSDLGEQQQALTYYNQALPLLRAVGDRRGEAGTLTSIGNVYWALGEHQQALTYYNQALPLNRAVGDRRGEAITLSNIGLVYSDLGEQQQAITYYNQSLPLMRTVGDRRGEAITLTNIGNVYRDLGEQQQALTYYNQALPLNRTVGDRGGEAGTLTNIGVVYWDLGEKQQAMTYFNQSLPLMRTVGDRGGEATTLTNIGNFYWALGDNQQALTYYNQALSLSRAVGDRRGEAIALSNIGLVERQQGNLTVALMRLDEAIKIVEDLRVKITSPELRTTYFATKQDVYQSKIDLLMELHKQNPSKGYDIQALETTDRSRARSLVELLTESKADIRVGIEPKLLVRERDLDRRRDALEREKQKLASIKDSDPAIANLNQQIDKLIKEQEELRTEIRIASPSYAALKFPTPLTLRQIQQKVLDDNTLLLTYSLGDDRSYLWLVSKTEIQSYELPKRSIIEAKAQKFYEEQKINPAQYIRFDGPEFGAQLSQILLQPVANKLGKKRLLIVADGALQYIPFAALPLCKDATCDNPSQLITNHEIVNAPSISTIDIIRTSKRRTPTKTLAVIADPVFGADDPRVSAQVREAKLPPKDSSKILASQQLERSARESGIMKFDRIKGTSDEADSILPLVPSNMRLKKVSFDANREFVTTSPEIGKYRYISFATHGILNSNQPELSGLVLSRIDKKGKSLNGFLQLNDIFNLQLSADLVVLSACETGLGKEIRGEGSIGLTRGFMYAGTPRVVVSLWQVSDDGTAELMKKFYTNILQKKLTPAAALRAAQLEMSKDKKYADPYYWAGFTLQGEWK